MSITKNMLKDIDRIAPRVEALTAAYQAGYRRRTIDYCTQSLVSAAIGLAITGIMVAVASNRTSTEENEEPES